MNWAGSGTCATVGSVMPSSGCTGRMLLWQRANNTMD